MIGKLITVTAVAACLFTLPKTARASELMLTCQDETGFLTSIFVINTTSGQVIQVDKVPARYGHAAITHNAYIIHFSASDVFREGVVTINRYTGIGEFEFGDPPFGELNLNNIYHEKTCNTGPVETKF
jgi:hypothetical protein